MKILRSIYLGIIAFSLVLCSSTFNFTVCAEENGVYINDEYLTYDVEEENNEKHIYAYNRYGKIESHLIFKDNIVFEEDEMGNLNIVAYIENNDSQEVIQTTAVEPNWGGMIAARTRVNFPNPESSAATVITGIIIGSFFPGASAAYSIAVGIAEYVMSHNQHYIDQTCYYREAAGCPQYRWYDRYEYRNKNGALFRTVPLNRKSFIGVSQSPENPPACRMYGF